MSSSNRLTPFQRQVSLIRGSAKYKPKVGDLVVPINGAETHESPSNTISMLRLVGEVGRVVDYRDSTGFILVNFGKVLDSYWYRPDWVHPALNAKNKFKEGETVFSATTGAYVGVVTGVIGDYVLLDNGKVRKYTGLCLLRRRPRTPFDSFFLGEVVQ